MGTAPQAQRQAAVVAARAALGRGEVVAVPTDTVYGLAADAANSEAIGRNCSSSRSVPAERSIAVLVADAAAAAALVDLTPQALRLADRFWPGPLTIVAPRLPAAPAHLGTDIGIGVRVPDDDMIRAIAADGPLAVTSANLHGAATPATAQGVAELVRGCAPGDRRRVRVRERRPLSWTSPATRRWCCEQGR